MLVRRDLTPIVDSDREVHGEVVSITISALGNGVRHPSAAVGEKQPITGGGSPDHPDPRSPRSAMDRRRCPREVTQLTSSLVNPDYLSDSHGAYLQKQTGAFRKNQVLMW